jgi:hypothetical protein
MNHTYEDILISGVEARLAQSKKESRSWWFKNVWHLLITLILIGTTSVICVYLPIKYRTGFLLAIVPALSAWIAIGALRPWRVRNARSEDRVST